MIGNVHIDVILTRNADSIAAIAQYHCEMRHQNTKMLLVDVMECGRRSTIELIKGE